MINDDRAFFKIKEFADLLKVHPNTVWRGIHSGYINAFRISDAKQASWRIPASEFIRLSCSGDLNRMMKRYNLDKDVKDEI